MAAPGHADDNDISAFLSDWDANSKGRIFISFAREDYGHAMKLKDAFRGSGYSVFTYLSDERSPIMNVDHIAHCLRTADIHYVLDTEFAREKTGVMDEATALQLMRCIEENHRMEEQVRRSLESTTMTMPPFSDIVRRYMARSPNKHLTDLQARTLLRDSFGIRENTFQEWSTERRRHPSGVSRKICPILLHMGWLRCTTF